MGGSYFYIYTHRLPCVDEIRRKELVLQMDSIYEKRITDFIALDRKRMIEWFISDPYLYHNIVISIKAASLERIIIVKIHIRDLLD